MYFDTLTRNLFIILLQVKDIFPTQEISTENNLAKYLNVWVANVFRVGIGDGFELITTMQQYKLKEFEYNISNNVNHFNSTFFFQNINYRVMVDKESDRWEPPSIHWEFSSHKMEVFFKVLSISISGMISAEKGHRFSNFHSVLHFKNFTSTAVGSYAKDNDLSVSNHGIKYDTLKNWLNIFWHNETLAVKDQEHLEQEIRPALVSMLLENLRNNTNFTNKLDEIFQTYETPRRKLISEHPDFSNNPQQYHCTVPETPFLHRFTLKDIVIRGLWNLASLKVTFREFATIKHLLIKNIRGRMTLDYRFENEPDLELQFQSGGISLLLGDEYKWERAYGTNFTFTRAKTNVSLSSEHKWRIMNTFVWTVASSLLPSAKGKDEIIWHSIPNSTWFKNETDLAKIKKEYKTWIPFNGV
ncbi:uncharacterized protein LOC135837304 [Planococcus citri]|uniref:uncharacterized protein LOC135837304 n=1 Tax=Planococcus citri TaxID=170843 RepID=UPI0031F79EEB